MAVNLLPRHLAHSTENKLRLYSPKLSQVAVQSNLFQCVVRQNGMSNRPIPFEDDLPILVSHSYLLHGERKGRESAHV